MIVVLPFFVIVMLPLVLFPQPSGNRWANRERSFAFGPLAPKKVPAIWDSCELDYSPPLHRHSLPHRPFLPHRSPQSRGLSCPPRRRPRPCHQHKRHHQSAQPTKLINSANTGVQIPLHAPSLFDVERTNRLAPTPSRNSDYLASPSSRVSLDATQCSPILLEVSKDSCPHGTPTQNFSIPE